MVALVMAFGAGALVSALTFDLSEEAFRVGGTLVFALGLAAGSLVYYTGAHIIGWRARGSHQRSATAGGPAIVLGALLDGVPESLVLGATMVGGAGLNPSFFAAVLISNLPEGLAGTRDLAGGGLSRRWILGLWVGVAVASGLAAAFGNAASSAMDPSCSPATELAAGAILTMLADTMFPEAFEGGGDEVGLATALGFRPPSCSRAPDVRRRLRDRAARLL